MIVAVQIMAVLYLMFAIRLRIWRTDLIGFLVILAFSIITISRESEYLRGFWVEYHLSVVAIAMTVLMARVVYNKVER